MDQALIAAFEAMTGEKPVDQTNAELAHALREMGVWGAIPHDVAQAALIFIRDYPEFSTPKETDDFAEWAHGALRELG